MARLSKARQRGLWPEVMPIGYGDRPRVEVAVSMEKDDYDWLAGFVHTTGHVWCAEDALNKAVEAMRGEEPMAYFADGIAWQHDVPASDLLFRPHGEADSAAVSRLYMAALFVAEVSRSGLLSLVRDENLPPADILALAQTALGEGRDLQAEIDAARKEVARIDAEDMAEAAAEESRPDDPDLDDDIPF